MSTRCELSAGEATCRRSRWRQRCAAAVAAFLGAAAVLAGAAAPASAASNGQWSIFPYRPPGTFGSGRAIFDYDAHPGDSFTDEFTISNFTNAPLDFYIYAGDGYDVANGGGFAIRARGEPNSGVGTWIHLPGTLNTVYTLPARTAANVPFTIDVPTDAAVGDHAGGIVALDVTPVPQANGHLQTQLRRGVGVRVYVHVLGPRHPALTVSGIAAWPAVPAFAFVEGTSHADVRFQVADTGNTIFDTVIATAWVTDVFGHTVHSYPKKFIEGMLPGNRVTLYEPRWKPLPVAGPLTIHVQLTAAGTTAAATSGFWVVPWVLLVVVLVLLALAGVWFWRRRRRRRAARGGEPPEPGAQEEATLSGASRS